MNPNEPDSFVPENMQTPHMAHESPRSRLTVVIPLVVLVVVAPIYAVWRFSDEKSIIDNDEDSNRRSRGELTSHELQKQMADDLKAIRLELERRK